AVLQTCAVVGAGWVHGRVFFLLVKQKEAYDMLRAPVAPAPRSAARHGQEWGPGRSGPTARAHRRPNTTQAFGDTIDATDPVTDWHCDESLRAMFLLRD